MIEHKNAKALLVSLGITVISTGVYKATPHSIEKAKDKLNKLKADKNVIISDECLSEVNKVLSSLEKEFEKDNVTESFLDTLDRKREGYLTEDTNIESLNDELKCYHNSIIDFFSRNGESKGIRNIYESIRNKDYNESTILSPDLNISQNIYEEYVDGMVQFIKDLDKSVTESSNTNEFSKKLSTAKERDKMFVESLFGGENNSEMELTLEEAIQNLEILIDFMPKIDMIYERCNSLKESVTSESDLVNESLNMLYESIGNFCYNEVRNIIDTYYSINDLFTEKTIEIPSDSVFVPF